tara:strand:+ start:455 stop:880 length:426 start_codon:yes stop_codon:yes gene_type:complete
MKEKITIYTSKTCDYCDQIKSKLKESSIKFIEKDTVESKEKWEEVWSLTANPTTPTIEIGGDFLISGRDFQQPEHLINVISNFKKSKHDDNRRTLELLKTFYFNFNQAFGGLYADMQAIKKNLNIEDQGFNTNENEHKSTS